VQSSSEKGARILSKFQKVHGVTAASALAGSLSWSSPASAVQPANDPVAPAVQGQAPAGEAAGDAGAIVVTGSRIRQTSLTSISPVSTLTREEILLDRAVDIETVLNKLPQFSGSFGATSNGADARGAATLDLRGLGQNRTLVLVNGTRALPFGFRNSV
jgi:outer membrane cobalamin receptor